MGRAGAETLLSFDVAGAIQGALAGAGAGLAICFAGGKGMAEQALIAKAEGAIWGATLGALLSACVGAVADAGIIGTGAPDKFLNIGVFGLKLADFSSASTAINSADNFGGVTGSLAQLSIPGGFNAGNLLGLLPNLVPTNEQADGWFSRRIGLTRARGAAGRRLRRRCRRRWIRLASATPISSTCGWAPRHISSILPRPCGRSSTRRASTVSRPASTAHSAWPAQ